MTGAEEPRPTREIRITCPQLLSYNPNSQREVMSLIISLAGVLGAGWIPAPPPRIAPSHKYVCTNMRKKEKRKKIHFLLFS